MIGRPGHDRTTQVIVVGGGIVGLSIAVHLRWLGIPVVVLERDRVGDGTSSRGFGTISAASREPDSYLRLMLAALRYFPEFTERLGCPEVYRVSGSITLIRNEEELAARRALIDRQRSVDSYDPGEILAANDLRRIEPALGDAFAWGQYRPDDAQLEPAGLLEGLLRAALNEGAELVQGAGVHATSRVGSDWRVETPVGAFVAPTLVNAAGAWSGLLGQQAGVSIPVRSIRGQIVVLGARSRLLHTTVSWDGRTDIRQARDGRVWLGTVQQPDSWDQRVHLHDTAAIVGRAAEAVPELRDGTISEAWAALRPVPVDELPLLGMHPEAPGYYVAVGHGGLSFCGVEGRGLAQQIAGRGVDPLLGPFDVGRPMAAPRPPDDAAAITEWVTGRAGAYDMRTEATDWSRVGTLAARGQRATAKMARAVGEQPLRPVPPAPAVPAHDV